MIIWRVEAQLSYTIMVSLDFSSYHYRYFTIMNFEIIAGERQNNLVTYQNENISKTNFVKYICAYKWKCINKKCKAKIMLVWYHYIIRDNNLQLLTMFMYIQEYNNTIYMIKIVIKLNLLYCIYYIENYLLFINLIIKLGIR